MELPARIQRVREIQKGTEHGAMRAILEQAMAQGKQRTWPLLHSNQIWRDGMPNHSGTFWRIIPDLFE